MTTIAELNTRIETEAYRQSIEIEESKDALRVAPSASLAYLYDLIPELSDKELQKLAAKYANNHAKFDSFAWYDEPADSQDWCIYYTSHRDSTLLPQSNAAFIDKAFAPYLENESPNILTFNANHWAVGYVNGYAIRVYDASGQITPEFCVLAEILRQLDEYLVLDEDDYSNRESEAELENTTNEIHYFLYSTDLEIVDTLEQGDKLTSDVLYWLSRNSDYQGENIDDQGACPSLSQIAEALTALGYVVPDYSDEELTKLAEIAKIKGQGTSDASQLPLFNGDK